jgi:hypothetical protein
VQESSKKSLKRLSQEINLFLELRGTIGKKKNEFASTQRVERAVHIILISDFDIPTAELMIFRTTK